ncbi:MAG: hypothetical protein ACYCTI_01320 [Acidimicrobiales bacterium]
MTATGASGRGWREELSLRLEKKTVVLLGSSRSGTSWLAEVLSENGLYRYVFEPLHPRNKRNRIFADAMPVPRPTDQARFRQYFDPLMGGGPAVGWSDRHSSMRASRRVLIKEIRANLGLSWLSDNYPDIKKVLLIRNPFAVTASRGRTLTDWHWPRPYFNALEQALSLDVLRPEERNLLLSDDLHPEEQMFLAWCLENVLPLRMISRPRSELKVVLYEDLVMRPDDTFGPLLAHLGDPERTVGAERLSRPSRLSRRPREGSREAYIRDWREDLSEATVDRLENAAAVFGIDQLYPDQLTPSAGGFYRLAGTHLLDVPGSMSRLTSRPPAASPT